MSSGPRLELRQGQSLVMTQQLQQSIKLLQCTSQELREFVDQELEKNPFLSQEEGESADSSPAEEQREAVPADDGEPREADFESDEHFSSDTTQEYVDADTEYLRQEQGASSRGDGYSGDDDARDIEDNAAQGMSLRDHLLEQLQLSIDDPAARLIGSYLIDIIDEAGYIKEDLNVVASTLGT